MGTALLVLVLVIGDFIVLGAIMHLAAQSWNDLAQGHPPVDPAPDAVYRNFQSFKFGPYGLGPSIHVAADDAHLHLTPARMWRACGMRATSIPWHAIALEKQGKRTAKARIDKHTLIGPVWALGLADESPAPNQQ